MNCIFGTLFNGIVKGMTMTVMMMMTVKMMMMMKMMTRTTMLVDGRYQLGGLPFIY